MLFYVIAYDIPSDKRRKKVSEDSLRFYPLSRHTLGQVVTWGVGPTVAEEPRHLIV